MILRNQCTFNFRLEGQLVKLSAVQFGALKELFDDGGALNAHVRIIKNEGENKEIHYAGLTDNIVSSLSDLCAWLTNLLQALQNVQAISENAENALKDV